MEKIKCAGSRRNLGEAFGFGGLKVVPCKFDADTAVKMGQRAVRTINGYRPLCWICAREYSDYKCMPIADAELTTSRNV